MVILWNLLIIYHDFLCSFFFLIFWCLNFFCQRSKQNSRRLICSVATENLPKPVEESKMDTPKEVFLKDYKMPNYYFDTVCMWLHKLKNIFLRTLNLITGFCLFSCSLMELPIQVDLIFSLGEEKTIVNSKITVFPRVEGNTMVILFCF